MLFLSCDVVLEFSRLRPIHVFKAARFFTHAEGKRVQKARDSAKERRKTDSVLFCGGLLWNTSVTRIKRLIDLYSISDLYIRVHWLCDRQVKEI